MTAQVLFHQLTYIDRLTRGGFTPDQARASAEALEFAFTEGVATKSDIAELKSEIGSIKSDLEHEIGSIKSSLEHEIGSINSGVEHQMGSLRSEIAATETRLKLEIATVRSEIAQSKNETLRWVFGFNLVLVGAIFAIIKYVH
jgi:hypothetical protein